METTQQTSHEAGQPKERFRNGLNITRLAQTIRAIQNDPSLADFKFRVGNQWIDAAHNVATVQGFYGTNQEIAHERTMSIEADEPPILLGADQGANPVEILLSALSACMTTSLVFHAASQGIDVEAVDSEFEGDIDLHGFMDLDPDVRKGYREIRVKFRVKSEADEEKLAELAKKSPVYDSLTQPVAVRLEVEKA